ncbi:MAG TPA: TraR/DksA family transcriptional regulator [Candidatus Binatia bacterium]|jgi:DnaK suppressor protein
MKQQLVKGLAEELRRRRSVLLLEGGNKDIAPEIVDERESEVEESAQVDRMTNIATHLEARDKRLLNEIETALDRVDAGEYGECERCGEDIGVARLRALPTATLCIDCAKELERKSKTRAGAPSDSMYPRAEADFQEEEA